MFGHKTIYKVTNFKVHSKGRYLVLKKSLFKNYSERLVWTTKLFTVNPAYWNSTGWRLGRMLGWALHVSKSKPSASAFISQCFWWKPTVFRKFGMSFSLHISSCLIKQRLWVELCFVYSFTGETALSTSTTAPPASRELICIYMRPQIVQVCGTMV